MLQKISKEVTAIHFQNFGSIVYLLQLENKNILIDTSSKENAKELINNLKQLNLTPEDINIIILTHAHYDHVQNINLFKNAKIYGNFTHVINPDHTQTKEPKIQPTSELNLNELIFYKLPGHTQGDIAILYKNILFSGDIIFHNGYIGRNDFPESNPKKQEESLRKLQNIKFDILCPGH